MDHFPPPDIVTDAALFGARWLERRRGLAFQGALGAPLGDATLRAHCARVNWSL